MAGDTIGHFRIVRKLGGGGMGEVYMAEDTLLNRIVALKVLRAEFASDEERLGRFLREARAASSLDHPSVTHIYEVGESDGTHFIAMQLVDGETVEQKIERQSLPIADLIDAGVQVAGAMEEAHSRGIIHRDLKPANILITPRNLVKVLDFGLAKISWQGGSEVDINEMETLVKTEPGLVVGTVDYMSPEQALGKPLDARTDIFSFGSFLYRAATGRLPFPGDRPMEIFNGIMSVEPEPPSIINSSVPAELERIILKCLEKDPDRRYQSARELEVDLKNLKRDKDTERRTGKRRSKRVAAVHLLRVAIVALLALGLVVASMYYRASHKTTIRSIAVFPFVNQSSDPDAEYLSDGITDNTINVLSRLPGLKVLARGTVFTYKGKDVDPRQAGKDLRVDAIVSGNIFQQGDEVSIQVSLVTTRDGAQIWGRRYLRKVSAVQNLQTEITSEISQELQSRIAGDAQPAKIQTRSHNPEAYQLYLRGLYHWNKRTGASLQKAIEYFKGALNNDPAFAQAYAGLANSYVLLSVYGVQRPTDAYPLAEEAAHKAMELDDTVAEAHAALALAKLNYENDWEGSEREFRRAIALNPNYATAHHWYGSNLLTAAGRFDEAEQEMNVAVDLDPLSLIINADVANTMVMARQYDRAIVQFRKTLEMDPNFYYARVYLGQAYALKGLLPEAEIELEKAAKLDNDPVIPASMGYVQAKSGRTEEARKSLQRLKELSETRYVSPYFSAVIHAAMGDADAAFAALKQAFDDRSEWVVYSKVDPFMDGLRSDPRFLQLLQRSGSSDR